jgi:hypothetical protein
MTALETAALLNQGIAAAKSGRREEARELFLRLIELDDHNEFAWLWMSSVVDDIEDQIICLENALTINPDSQAAKRGLEKLRTQIPPPAPVEPEPTLYEYEAEPAPYDAAPDEPEVDEVALYDPAPEEFEVDLAEPYDPVPPATPTVTMEEQVQPDRVCLHCGTPNPAWRDLCSLCGKMVIGAAAPMAIEPDPAPPVVVAPPVIEEIQPEPDIDTRPQGSLTLVAAWIAAIAFNKRGAYEYEIFSASVGRTTLGVIIGGVAIPLVGGVLALLLFAASSLDNILALVAVMGTGAAASVIVGLAVAVMLGVNFYLWAAGLYLVAWLMGGKASFIVHSQLLSIAYSASTLLVMFLVIIGGAILSLLGQSLTDASTALNLVGVLGPVALVAIGGIYSLAMVGQAISVAHRFSWLGGIGTTVLSGLLYGLLAVTLVLGALALSGLSFAEFQTLLTPIP